jgi:hypothetical protein
MDWRFGQALVKRGAAGVLFGFVTMTVFGDQVLVVSAVGAVVFLVGLIWMAIA